MAVLTAVEFFLAGVAFVTFDERTRRNLYPSEILTAVVLMLSLDSIIAFLYMSDTIPDIRTDSPIPIISSLMFVILSLGMLVCRQKRGVVAVWMAKYSGSRLVRRWLPTGILVFILASEIV